MLTPSVTNNVVSCLRYRTFHSELAKLQERRQEVIWSNIHPLTFRPYYQVRRTITLNRAMGELTLL
jgi:hypothetical protein